MENLPRKMNVASRLNRLLEAEKKMRFGVSGCLSWVLFFSEYGCATDVKPLSVSHFSVLSASGGALCPLCSSRKCSFAQFAHLYYTPTVCISLLPDARNKTCMHVEPCKKVHLETLTMLVTEKWKVVASFSKNLSLLSAV